MAVSLAPAATAQAGVRLDYSTSKYPQKARGARRLVRRHGKNLLRREIARGEA